jgi:hypothetical protein
MHRPFECAHGRAVPRSCDYETSIGAGNMLDSLGTVILANGHAKWRLD